MVFYLLFVLYWFEMFFINKFGVKVEMKFIVVSCCWDDCEDLFGMNIVDVDYMVFYLCLDDCVFGGLYIVYSFVLLVKQVGGGVE